MEWIKTSDRMPPNDDGKWLLFVFEGEVKMGSFEIFRSGDYWVDFMGTRFHPDRVHYWMPLPSSPNHIVPSDKKVEDTPTTNSLESTI